MTWLDRARARVDRVIEAGGPHGAGGNPTMVTVTRPAAASMRNFNVATGRHETTAETIYVGPMLITSPSGSDGETTDPGRMPRVEEDYRGSAPHDAAIHVGDVVTVDDTDDTALLDAVMTVTGVSGRTAATRRRLSLLSTTPAPRAVT